MSTYKLNFSIECTPIDQSILYSILYNTLPLPSTSTLYRYPLPLPCTLYLYHYLYSMLYYALLYSTLLYSSSLMYSTLHYSTRLCANSPVIYSTLYVGCIISFTLYHHISLFEIVFGQGVIFALSYSILVCMCYLQHIWRYIMKGLHLQTSCIPASKCCT